MLINYLLWNCIIFHCALAVNSWLADQLLRTNQRIGTWAFDTKGKFPSESLWGFADSHVSPLILSSLIFYPLLNIPLELEKKPLQSDLFSGSLSNTCIFRLTNLCSVFPLCIALLDQMPVHQYGIMFGWILHALLRPGILSSLQICLPQGHILIVAAIGYT